MNSTLNQIYAEGIKYSQAQEICRKVLIQKVSVYNFKNAEIKSRVNNIAQSIAFPIEYKTDIDQLAITRNGYKNLAYGLFAVGAAVAGITLFSKKISSDFWSILSGLSIGLSFRVYKASKQTEIRKRYFIITPQETLVRYIDEAYNNLILLDNISWETRTVHKELLIWFQKLYSWSCRESERLKLKEDIEDIMMKFGYEFCEYAPIYADFFDATNANVESVTTTVYALLNANDHDIILRGKVVFPIE